jgi:transcriptional/translational regulatory protein YebC/TACO1
VVEVIPYTLSQLEDDLMSLDIEDFQEEEGNCRVITSREAFIGVRKSLDAMQYSITDADFQYLPQNEIELTGEDFVAFEKIIDALESDEDVDSIYTNVG